IRSVTRSIRVKYKIICQLIEQLESLSVHIADQSSSSYLGSLLESMDRIGPFVASVKKQAWIRQIKEYVETQKEKDAKLLDSPISVAGINVVSDSEAEGRALSTSG